MRRHVFLARSLIVTLISLLPVMNAAALDIIAHRGASYDAPENSLSALKLGYEQKADAGECDIYLTKDGKIILMHDRNTLRTTGISNVMSQVTAAELRRLPVGQWGQWKGSKFTDTIPSLEEVLSIIPNGKRLFIEIKCGPEIVPELKRVLKQSGKKARQTPIIGFDLPTVTAAKAAMPELEVSWLVSADKQKKYPPVDEMIAKAKAAKLDGLDLNYGFPIDKEFVKKVRNAGLKLYVWTVDDPAVARAMADAGVDGITTNRPEWLRQQLAASK